MAARGKRLAVLAAMVSASVASGGITVAALGDVRSASAAGKSFEVVNGTVDAAAVHVIAGSSAFPNFRSGALDNFYPMAHSHVDNSPFAQGMASPADTGPGGQTVAAGAAFHQPQYADARWPGGHTQPETVGERPGPYARATAQRNEATAFSSEASLDLSGSGAVAEKLRRALHAWKARFFEPVGQVEAASRAAQSEARAMLADFGVAAANVPDAPKPGPSPSSSPRAGHKPRHGVDGIASSSSATLDPGSDSLVTAGDSRIARVSIAGGAIQIRAIHVSARITNGGSPKEEISIEIGAAEVGGVPVTIDQKGVHVADQGVDLGKTYKQADKALNDALKQAGVKIFTVRPQIKRSAHQETVEATGVHVDFEQPEPPPGVPSQFAGNILGEVFLDSLAIPAAPLPPVDLGGGGGTTTTTAGGTAARTRYVPGTAGSPGEPPRYEKIGGGGGVSQAGGEVRSPQMATVSAHIKPMWLLLMYFLWQSLIIGTGASLWWLRMEGAT